MIERLLNGPPPLIAFATHAALGFTPAFPITHRVAHPVAAAGAGCVRLRWNPGSRRRLWRAVKATDNGGMRFHVVQVSGGLTD